MKLKLALTLTMILMMGVLAGPAMAIGQGTCDTGFDQKVDGPGPLTLQAPAGMVFTGVIVKAGSEVSNDDSPCTSFTSDGSNACYSVSGIGTGTLNVSKIGDGPDCKDISHVELFWGNAEQEIDDETKPPEDETTPTTPQEITQTTSTTGDPNPTAADTAAQDPSVVRAATPAATSLPSTGLMLFTPLAGMGMAAAGLWLRKRRG